MSLVLACAVMNFGIAIFVELKSGIETFKVKYAAWKVKKTEAKNNKNIYEEAEVEPKYQISQLNPNYESSNYDFEEKDFGRKNDLQMFDRPNEFPYKQYANIQDNSCVPEEMKDSFYIQECEFVNEIA